MNLFNEAKKSNKQAFYDLVDNYKHVFYKVTRIFFINDDEIYPIIEKSLMQSYKELVNMKNEKDFLCCTLKILIFNCTKQTSSNNYRKKIGNRDITVYITDKIAFSESNIDNLEYQKYRRTSIVEEYLTSIPPVERIPALLYFYANLSIEDISKILKDSEKYINEIIKKSRIKLYEIIKNKEVDL